MQEEVTAASETSDAFSDETLKEYTVFQHEKQAEMKEMLSAVADGQIELYKKVRVSVNYEQSIIPSPDGFPVLFWSSSIGNGRLGQADPHDTAYSC